MANDWTAVEDDVCMILRALCVGDDEQTRIDDDTLWRRTMPVEWYSVGRTLIEAGMYDEACVVWLKYHLRDRTRESIADSADVWLAANPDMGVTHDELCAQADRILRGAY